MWVFSFLKCEPLILNYTEEIQEEKDKMCQCANTTNSFCDICFSTELLFKELISTSVNYNHIITLVNACLWSFRPSFEDTDCDRTVEAAVDIV